METNINEIATDVYRISTFAPDYGLEFNQFLIKDEQPFLMHTGFRKMFDVTREAVAKIVDPATLRWIGFSHFEPDECGALNEWLQVAPDAQAACSVVCNTVMLNDYADRPARPLNDNEVLEIGKRRLRFLATPHLPHSWDAGLFFEETDQTLLCSDLFFHPQSDVPLIESDIVGRARESILFGMQSPLAKDMPYTPYTDSTMQRLAELAPRTLALMHGSSFRGDGRKAIEDLAAVIRETHGREGDASEAATGK
jgi:flavorubredoxin